MTLTPWRCAAQGVGDGSGGDLQLHDEDGGGGDEIGGGVDVGRRDFGVGAGGDDDGVFAVLVDEDDGGASGGAFGDGDVVGLDAMLAQGDEEVLSESSFPTRPMRWTASPARRPWRRRRPGGPLPPGMVRRSWPGRVSPGWGRRVQRQTRSMLTEPRTTMGFSVGMGWFYRRGVGGDTPKRGWRTEHPTFNIQHSTFKEREGCFSPY